MKMYPLSLTFPAPSLKHVKNSLYNKFIFVNNTAFVRKKIKLISWKMMIRHNYRYNIVKFHGILKKLYFIQRMKLHSY